MPNVPNGYQPDTRSESSRRADFDLLRRMRKMVGEGGGGEFVSIAGDTMTGDLILPRIRLIATDDVSETSTLHAFQIGPDTGANMRMDTNELMALINGVFTQLNLVGKPVQIGPNDGWLGFADITARKIDLYGDQYTIGIQSATVYHRTSPTGRFAWYVGGVHSETGLDPGAGGVEVMRLEANATLVVGEDVSNASPLRLVGDAFGSYMALYNNGGTRSGYVGFPANDHLYVKNERATGNIYLINAGSLITFSPANVEAGRFSGEYFLVGKTSTAAYTTTGDVFGPQTNYMTSDVLHGGLNMTHISAGDATGSGFIMFRRTTSGTQVGSVTQLAGGSTVAYNTSSDYRLKDVLGPIERPVERVKLLRPVHFAWKADGHIQDGFIAHEVAEVEDNIVTGEKDALDDDGNIEAQQMDASKLIPLLTAALQEALAQIESMQRRLDILEAR